MLISNFSVIKASELTIETNDVSANAKVSAGSQMFVSEVYVHPKYNKAEQTSNVALLWLKKAVKFNEDLSPVCLPVSGLVSQLNCTAEGNPHIKYMCRMMSNFCL